MTEVTTFESVVTELETTMKPTTAKPVNTDFPATSAERQTTSSTEQQMKATATQQQTTSEVQTTMITIEQTTKSTQQQTTKRVETTSGLTEGLKTSPTTPDQVQSGIGVQTTSESESKHHSNIKGWTNRSGDAVAACPVLLYYIWIESSRFQMLSTDNLHVDIHYGPKRANHS